MYLIFSFFHTTLPVHLTPPSHQLGQQTDGKAMNTNQHSAPLYLHPPLQPYLHPLHLQTAPNGMEMVIKSIPTISTGVPMDIQRNLPFV